MFAGCRLASVLLVLGFFFDVHIVVRDDTSGKMSAIYRATPISTVDTERFRFNSPATETEHVHIEDGVAGVRVAFKDVTRISEAPELSFSAVELSLPRDGTRRLRAKIRGPVLTQPIPADRPARVRVTFPNDVVDTTGKRDSGRTISWFAPVGQYFTEAGIDLDATYRTRAQPPEAQARAEGD